MIFGKLKQKSDKTYLARGVWTSITAVCARVWFGGTLVQGHKHEKDHWWSGAKCILCSNKDHWCVKIRKKQVICATCVTLIHDAASGNLHRDQLSFNTKDPNAGYPEAN